MQQPSAQGIAALFRGNPQPLQQRIQQEQQAKPGIPPDLQKLLALNIVTNEQDAVAKQQAMDQLAQMQGGPQGQMPTVMQSVQEQARQKMLAQQVQAQQQEQQQQQGIQALMQQAGPAPVPPETPQPQAQPQGIDELPVNFQMAGGGIVAFQNRGSVPSPTEKDLEEQKKSDSEILRMIGNTLGEGAKDVATKLVAAGADIASLIPRGLAGAVDAAVIRPARALGADIGYISPELTPGDQSPDTMTPFYDRYIRGREQKSSTPVSPESSADYSNEGRTGPRPYTPEPKPVADLKALAEQQQRQQAPRPARPAMAAPVASAAAATPMAAPQVAMPPQESEADLIQKAAMRKDPEAERIEAAKRRLEAIGAPDTSVQDRMIAELEKRKAQLEGPKDQWGQLMEYLSQVSATPRGLSSFEAGAAGVRNVKALEQTRQLEQYNLTKQALDVSQKKLDTVRAFATEQYNVGENRFNQVYKDQFEAAKQVSANEQDARKLAQQNTLKMLELEQQATLDRERMQNQLKVANIGQTREYNEQARINKITSLKQQARRATDPKVAAELMAQAADLEMAVGRGGAGGTAGVGAENAQTRMLRDAAKDIDVRLDQLMNNGEEKTAEYAMLKKKRQEISGLIVGRVLKEAGVGGESGGKSGGIDKSNPLLK